MSTVVVVCVMQIFNHKIQFPSNATVFSVKNMFFVILVYISTIAMATASDDYCEWGYCYLSEYCCGDNMCCPDNGTTWILICGLLSALVAISICCGCLFRYYDTYRLRMQWPFSRREPLLPHTEA